MGANFIVFIILIVLGLALAKERYIPGGREDDMPEDIVNTLPPDMREGFKEEWYKPFMKHHSMY